MNNQKSHYDDDINEPLMDDDMDFADDAVIDEEEERIYRSSNAFNMSTRHRIEDRLEQRRLLKELNDYEYMNLDDDTYH